MRRILASLFLLAPLMAMAADSNCPDLSTLQRLAGFANWIGFFQILGIGLITGGIGFIFWGVIKSILEMASLMEALLWLITLGMLITSAFVPTVYQTWTVPVGSILVPCAFSLSAYLRKIKIKEVMSLTILTLIWATIAIFFDSAFVGFLAVGSLLAALGFSVVVTPFSYGFGFADDDAVPRGTAAGLAILAIYIALRIFRVELGAFSVFETGALWLASFVGFVGLLITSSLWYEKGKHWSLMNFVTLVALVGSTSLAVLFGIKEVTTMASAFLIFYLAAKIVEIDTESTAVLGIKLLIAGLMLAGVWMLLRSNEQLVAQYLSL